MGNKASQTGIGVKVDQAGYRAGEELTGRVYLALHPGDPTLRDVPTIRLAFRGVECVVVSEPPPLPTPIHRTHGDQGPSRQNRQRTESKQPRWSTSVVVVERETHVFEHTDVPLAELPAFDTPASCTKNRETSAVGHYEYPFRYRLPDHLPNTILCTHHDRRSLAQVSYTLTAYLGSADPNQDRAQIQASTPVFLKAQCDVATVTDSRYPLVVETKPFPVAAGCLGSKGKVHLGWQLDRTTACPGGTVVVHVLGENRSKRAVHHMGIRLVERILWKTPGDQTWMASRKKTMERTLVERSIPMTRSPGPWQPLSQPSRDPNHETSPLTMSVPLKIPHESRVSYVGRLLEVRHTLIVTALVKRGCTASWPESSGPIRIMPALHGSGSSSDLTNGRTPVPPSNPFTPTAELVVGNWDSIANQGILQAHVLPNEWHPIAAEAIVLPESSVVSLEPGGGTCVTATSTSAPTVPWKADI